MRQLLLIATLGLASCQDAPSPAPPATATVTMAVEGIQCRGCVMAIQEAVERLEGVGACRVSLETGRAEVDLDPSRVSEEGVVATIEGLGYHVAQGEPEVEATSPSP